MFWSSSFEAPSHSAICLWPVCTPILICVTPGGCEFFLDVMGLNLIRPVDTHNLSWPERRSACPHPLSSTSRVQHIANKHCRSSRICTVAGRSGRPRERIRHVRSCRRVPCGLSPLALEHLIPIVAAAARLELQFRMASQLPPAINFDAAQIAHRNRRHSIAVLLICPTATSKIHLKL